MIAYNKNWLDNLCIQAELETTVAENFMSEEEKIRIEKLYIVGFYSPDYFIRIGLFILTIIIAGFSAGLVSLILLGGGSDMGFGILLILFSIVAYVFLELIIKYKMHYKSGVDDALLWLSGISFIAGLNLLVGLTAINNTLIILVVAFYFLVRFSNAVMGVITTVTLLLFIYFLCIIIGGFLLSAVNFIVAVIASFIYFYSKKMFKIEKLKYYQNGLLLIKITSLICLYVVLNYYVVKEQPLSIIRNSINAGTKIQFAWLYWLLTVAVPFIYIFKGIQKKDRVLLRVGMILIAPLIFTIRYYYAILPVELAMAMGGLVLIGLAYALIKYLPRYGFTYEFKTDRNLLDKLNIEALIITESFTGAASVNQPAADNKTFGGGNLGGGGASGDF